MCFNGVLYILGRVHGKTGPIRHTYPVRKVHLRADQLVVLVCWFELFQGHPAWE